MATPAHTLTVTHVEHYTDSYFRLRTTRPEGLRFVSGQFIMLGLELESGPLMRAYSIASAVWDEELEFYSIIIEDGALTSRLKHIKVGDEVALQGPIGTIERFAAREVSRVLVRRGRSPRRASRNDMLGTWAAANGCTAAARSRPTPWA